MNAIRVDSKALTLSFKDKTIPCAIGRSGACSADTKTEGDGYTPLGSWSIRGALFRPGRSTPPNDITLPWRWIGKQDGWSDDPVDPSYNRPVRLPHPFSAETLIRDDPLYDVIVVLGHNDAPPEPGNGSAIFFHVWNDSKPTAGCVAIARDEMDALLPRLTAGEPLEIR
ncbi:MAG: L,D-transpeptidase family protein [Parasphingorhabdus sp.]